VQKILSSLEVWFLPARRYASASLTVVVCPFVHLSQASTVPKQLNIVPCKQRHMIAQGI